MFVLARPETQENAAVKGQAKDAVAVRLPYDYDEVRALVAEFGFTAHIPARREEAVAIKQEAGFRARRWVVERTHSRMNRFRRVLIHWEKVAKTYLAFLHLACAVITWRALGLLEEALNGTDELGDRTSRHI
jgi:transposase